MCSQERWVGQGSPGNPQQDGSSGFQAVAVKETEYDAAGKRERYALKQVRRRIKDHGIPGPHHVILLHDMWTGTAAGGKKMIVLVTK